MNGTNYTEYEDSSVVPLIEPELVGDYDESEEVEFHTESSILKIFPKFFKAIATILISGLLLGGTFLLITLWKRGCRTHSKLEDETKGKNGSAGAPLHSVIVTPPDDDSLDESPAIPSSSNIQPISAKHMKVPNQKRALLRRASGPFGSEALSFVGEQYSMKNIEKERHHHTAHGHHHHHHHHQGSHPDPQRQYYSGASSAGGGSAQNVEEGTAETTETKSKWNCFSGNKE